MRAVALALSIAAGLGCGPKEPGRDSAGAEPSEATGSADGSDGADGSGGESGGLDAPVVTAADAWCYAPDADTRLWLVAAAFRDPQGLDTVEAITEDAVLVTRDGEAVATYALTCSASGECSGGFNQTADGVRCEDASAYAFAVSVRDVDGHWSEPVVVTGRQGDSPAGR